MNRWEFKPSARDQYNFWFGFVFGLAGFFSLLALTTIMNDAIAMAIVLVITIGLLAWRDDTLMKMDDKNVGTHDSELR